MRSCNDMCGPASPERVEANIQDTHFQRMEQDGNHNEPSSSSPPSVPSSFLDVAALVGMNQPKALPGERGPPLRDRIQISHLQLALHIVKVYAKINEAVLSNSLPFCI